MTRYDDGAVADARAPDDPPLVDDVRDAEERDRI